VTERAEEGALPFVELVKHGGQTRGLLKLHDSLLWRELLQCGSDL
jgi:hypothetical protein